MKESTMSNSKVAQMLIRGFIMLLMSVGFFLNSESKLMKGTSAFMASGVFGSCFIVSMALMIEAGLHMRHSDDFIECSFCVVGVTLNIVMTTLAFYEYSYGYSSEVYPFENNINKGIIGVIAAVVYLCDIALVFV